MDQYEIRDPAKAEKFVREHISDFSASLPWHVCFDQLKSGLDQGGDLRKAANHVAWYLGYLEHPSNNGRTALDFYCCCQTLAR